MEDVKCSSVGVLRGCYDAVVGTGIVKSLDAEQRKRAAARATAASSAPTTALAQRRAAAQAAALGAPSAHHVGPATVDEQQWPRRNSRRVPHLPVHPLEWRRVRYERRRL
ncbi:hypothetical protein V5799_004225 [Amblyomma americanum]|uniref:Uncharacterized protein n=1 Tax=Amblyomma americanum TaxID=6943 RepID=A0AAQ4D6Q2_AMBAM